MTIQSISWVLDQSDAQGRTRCVAIALANRFDAKEPLKCWPGMALVAREAKTSHRTAQRCIEELVYELQELVVVLNAGGDLEMRGDRRPNVFLFAAILGEDRLRDLLANYPREQIQSGPRWAACLPARSTARQVVMPLDDHGMSGTNARGDNNAADGVPDSIARHDTAVTQTDIDPTVDPTGTFASGCAERTKARPRDELWDSMLAACQLTGVSPTPSERGAWNKALKGLRTVDATPAEIARRARAYRDRWPNVTLTPTALERHWGEVLAQADVVDIVTRQQHAPLEPDHDDRVLARLAIEALNPGIRAAFGDELLMEGALKHLDCNPIAGVNDLALVAEEYASDHQPLNIPEPAR